MTAQVADDAARAEAAPGAARPYVEIAGVGKTYRRARRETHALERTERAHSLSSAKGGEGRPARHSRSGAGGGEEVLPSSRG